MSEVGGVGNQYYQLFVDLYGTEAAEKAKEAGLFDKLESGEITWDYITQWAEEQGYQPKLPPPGDGDVSGARGIFDAYFDVAVLFHEICREMRRTRREDSFLMQQKIVQALKDAAAKKIEAADKLASAALKGLILSIVAGVISIGGAAASFMAAARAIAKAATRAAEEAVKRVTQELTKVAEEAIKKAIKEATKTGQKVTKEVVEKAVKEAIEQSMKSVIEKATKEAVQQVAKNVMGKAASKAVVKEIENVAKEAAEKAANQISKNLVSQVSKIAAQSSKAAKVLGESLETIIKETTQNITKNITKEVFKEMATTLKKMDKTIMQALTGKWQAVAMGAQGASQIMHGGATYTTTTGQAESQSIQAEGDKIQAAAEGMKGMKQREDEYLAEINDTLRSIQQKLAEFEAARAKQWEAAATV